MHRDTPWKRESEASRQRASATETRISETAEPPAAKRLAVPTLTVAAHPVLGRVGEVVALSELVSGQTVELSRTRPLFAQPGSAAVRPLDVAYLSRTPLLLVPTADGGITLDRAGSRTPVTVDGEPLGEGRCLGADELSRGVVLELGGRVVLLLDRQPLAHRETPRFGLVGDSYPMACLRREIETVAGSATPVILRGLSGTGKELVARAIHAAGPRGDKPWVAVNMAAIPPTLAAAELFGALKGSFTGADRRKDGYFLAADGGTLFLDEIGDTPQEVQPLLLRALESGEIQPVGGAQSRRVDVRVITATDSDLEARIADGHFRSSLLHRLAGYEIRLPPLAERRSDVGRLLVHFLERELEGTALALTAAAGTDARPWPPASLVARLVRYDWPGNVRQLANVARRLALARRSGSDATLEPTIESLLVGDGGAPATPATISAKAGPGAPAPAQGSPTGRWRPVYRKASEVSEDELVDALRAHRFEVKATADALGVSRAKLYQLIEACPRVRTAADLGREEIAAVLEHAEGDLDAAARVLEVSLQGLKMRLKTLGLPRTEGRHG